MLSPGPSFNFRSYINLSFSLLYETVKCLISIRSIFSISSKWTISCKCVAKIALVSLLCNISSPETKILTAESCSVPEHNSSPKIRLFLSAIFKITLNSDISTANVERPLNKLSFPKILVNIPV